MKVIHVLKSIEILDRDIKDLRKLEKSIKRNKSFSTPIYMTIEKQINILLGERIKMLELKIENPPEKLVTDTDEPDDESEEDIEAIEPEPKIAKQTGKKKVAKISKPEPVDEDEDDYDEDDEDDENDLPMFTQSDIDEKIQNIEKDKTKEKKVAEKKKAATIEEMPSDENVKLLDIALEKGTLQKKEIIKEKKKVRFFKDNFPGGEY